MYLFLLLFCCVAVIVDSAKLSLENASLHFEDFIRKFDKKYANDQEKEHRYQIFKENLLDVIHLNEKSQNAEFGITKFMDLTTEEFVSQHTGLQVGRIVDAYCTTKVDKDIPWDNAPASWDWREHGVVSPVKDQGHCGSCYAFSTVGHLEGQYAIKNKKLIQFSEQQIVNCDHHSIWCYGGSPTASLRSIIEMGGIEIESDYSYNVTQKSCTFDKNKVAFKISDCLVYNLVSQEKVKQLLYNVGPLTIGLKGAGIQKYHSGILADDQCNAGPLSHAVLLVGYGSENDRPYWIVKNSWGKNWGEKGYFRMQRGEKAKSCGMLLEDNNAMASAVI